MTVRTSAPLVTDQDDKGKDSEHNSQIRDFVAESEKRHEAGALRERQQEAKNRRDVNTFEQKRAAVQIQAHFRGHLVRKDVTRHILHFYAGATKPEDDGGIIEKEAPREHSANAEKEREKSNSSVPTSTLRPSVGERKAESSSFDEVDNDRSQVDTRVDLFEHTQEVILVADKVDHNRRSEPEESKLAGPHSEWEADSSRGVTPQGYSPSTEINPLRDFRSHTQSQAAPTRTPVIDSDDSSMQNFMSPPTAVVEVEIQDSGFQQRHHEYE